MLEPFFNNAFNISPSFLSKRIKKLDGTWTFYSWNLSKLLFLKQSKIFVEKVSKESGKP